MSNNNWYDNSDWYEPLHTDAVSGSSKPKKRGWTKARIGGIIALVLVLLVGSSLLFANTGGSSVSFSWNSNGKSGSWSSGNNQEMPQQGKVL